MKNLKIFKLIFLLFISSQGMSQGEFNNWHFGNQAHLDFNPTPVVTRTGSLLNTGEGCASVSDRAGKLLFYTDGSTVWDNTNSPMTNGTGLLGNPSSSNSAIIVPRPGNTSQYYIFTVDDVTGTNGVNYSIVDMNLRGNLGDVTATKNASILTGANQGDISEKLSVVKHRNGRHYWVVAADAQNNEFEVFLLNNTTVSLISTQTFAGVNINPQGVMKHSPDGSRLAIANLRNNTGVNSANVRVMNFDNNTGLISGARLVNLPLGDANYRGYYGVEFSPNSQMLYFSRYTGNTGAGFIYQANLRLGTPAIQIGNANNIRMGALQLTPESPQRILIAKYNSNTLAQITNPNVGTFNITAPGIILGANQSQLGLPSFVSGPITIDSSDYCCDESPNLIRNGNFEAGNVWFSTGSYTLDPTPMPHEYYVGTRADALANSPNWIAEDHSKCNLSVSNNQFLMVNGRTQQTTGTIDVIWESTINNTTGDTIDGRFCANFRNFPQCTFDTMPIVDLQIVGGNSSGWTLINTNPTNQCDWQNISISGTLLPGNNTLRIVLQVDANADGNDLAIDDISFQEFAPSNTYITVKNNGGSNTVTASVFDLTSADDSTLCDSNYSWYVEEVATISPTLTFVPGTQAIGNMAGNNWLTPAASWNLTTTFPGYNFINNRLYFVGFFQPENDDCCQEESLTYQLTLNSRSVGILSDAEEKRIIDYIKNGGSSGSTSIPDQSKNKVTSILTAFPNPATNVLRFSLSNSSFTSYKVLNKLGQVVINSDGKEVSNQISIEELSTGTYFLKVIDEQNIPHSVKFIKL